MREIVLSGPGKNALSSDLMGRTLDAVRAADEEPILLIGEGDAFSAGLDLREVATLDGAAMTRFLDLLDALCRAIFEHTGPTVACVNGHAIAGGCVLAMACDYRVATTNGKARIGLNETAIGLAFPPLVTRLVRARMPRGSEREVLLGAGLFEPSEALRLGLLDELAHDPRAAALATLEALSAPPRAAYRINKHQLTGGVLDVTPDEQASFRQYMLPLWTGPDLKARLRAHLDKRKG